MIIKNAMQLKAFIKNQAKEKNISAQLVLQNYLLERLLERISISSYKNNFIIKGGFLISSIVGLDTRATMDLDTTIKGISLTKDNIQKIFNEICTIEIQDNINFEILSTIDIREKDDYPGIRVNLIAKYDPISTPLSVDITTGDIITPNEISYEHMLMFENRKINIKSYNVETIISEKIETILSRAEANTRPRDYYDVYILLKLHLFKCDMKCLKNAIENTFIKRSSYELINKRNFIINKLKESSSLLSFWNKYKNEYNYASGINFEDICDSINNIMDYLFDKN